MRTVFVLKRLLVYGGEEFLSVYGNKARAVKAFTEEANKAILEHLGDADEDSYEETMKYYKGMNDWWSIHTVKTTTVERWGKEYTVPQVTLSAMKAEFEDEPNKVYFVGTGEYYTQRILEFDACEQGEWDDTSGVVLTEVVLE